MNTKIITVADVIEFFKTIPPDTKIRVKEEYSRNWETSTRYVEAEQYGESFNNNNGIEYNNVTKTVDFGI
jgi:hypothetical protein